MKLVHGQVQITPDTHEGLLDMMVNGNTWLGQLGALRTAVLDGDVAAARELAAEPIRFQPWRTALSRKQV
jgi:hypothetical protein